MTTALDRLATFVAERGERWPPLRSGGTVAAADPGALGLRGLANHVRIGDTLAIPSGDGGRALAEIVRVAPDGVVAKPLDDARPPRLGTIVWRGPPLSIAPDPSWAGRVVDALCTPIDGEGPLRACERPRALATAPPAPLARAVAGDRLHTGIRAIDLFTPLVHGQRVAVMAGSGVGKSTLLAMMASAAAFDVAVIALVGERGREVRALLEGPLADCRARAVTVVATADEGAPRRRAAALTAMTVAEAFRDAGCRVLLVVDSLTRYAHALREIAIAAGELPVARGYPASLLQALPAYLERAGPGGRGSITALVSVLVDGDDRMDPVADIARGSLDGHLVLDRRIAEAGRYPAVDVLASLSRLADAVWTDEQRQLVQRLRAMIAAYEDTRDLRAIDRSAAESDPELAQAVALVPRIYDALRQSPNEPPSGDVYADLAAMLRAPPAG